MIYTLNSYISRCSADLFLNTLKNSLCRTKTRYARHQEYIYPRAAERPLLGRWLLLSAGTSLWPPSACPHTSSSSSLHSENQTIDNLSAKYFISHDMTYLFTLHFMSNMFPTVHCILTSKLHKKHHKK
jgi:hypothetical protein